MRDLGAVLGHEEPLLPSGMRSQPAAGRAEAALLRRFQFAGSQPRTFESIGSLEIIIVWVRLHFWQSNVRYSKPDGPASVLE